MNCSAVQIASERPTLVGFRSLDPNAAIGAGAYFIPVGAPVKAGNDEGRTTSACWSPVLKQTLGMGLLKNGATRMGERMRAVDPIRKRDVTVEICPPVFIDPEGERLRA